MQTFHNKLVESIKKHKGNHEGILGVLHAYVLAVISHQENDTKGKEKGKETTIVINIVSKKQQNVKWLCSTSPSKSPQREANIEPDPSCRCTVKGLEETVTSCHKEKSR